MKLIFFCVKKGPEQEKHLRTMCEYKDAGISVKTGNFRPRFEELLQDIREKM